MDHDTKTISKEPFRKASTDVQGPHVQREVKKPEVQEYRRNRATPLAVRAQRAEVCTPRLQNIRIGNDNSCTIYCRSDKDQNVCSHQCSTWLATPASGRRTRRFA